MSDAREAKEMENGERLAKMEQQTENIVRLVTEMNENLKTFTAVYVPRTEINLMFQARDNKIDELKEELKKKADTKEVERIVTEKDNWQKNLPTWLTAIIAIVALFLPFLTN